MSEFWKLKQSIVLEIAIKYSILSSTMVNFLLYHVKISGFINQIVKKNEMKCFGRVDVEPMVEK